MLSNLARHSEQGLRSGVCAERRNPQTMKCKNKTTTMRTYEMEPVQNKSSGHYTNPTQSGSSCQATTALNY